MRIAVVLFAVALLGCAGHRQPAAPETVTVRDPELERELARYKIQLLERSAQLAESDRRLGEATTEVVRAMARLRTLATRAEAASAIAEAEVTLQLLLAPAGQPVPPEAHQAELSLASASSAFDAENYGGAVYLATQAKRVATAGRGRLAEGGAAAHAAERAGERTGERAFAVPVPLITTSRVNLRAAPNATATLVVAVPSGTLLTAYAYAQDWLRVTMADGRSAWVHQSLVRGVASGAP